MRNRAIINAGGQRFEACLATLQRYPNTPFAKMFQLPSRGRRGREFFLDVTPQVFECVLSFLRTQQLNLPTDNAQVRAEIVHSLNIWGLLEHAFPPSKEEARESLINAPSVVLPDICVVQICDHMQHDQGVKRHALTITFGADGFQLRRLTQRIRHDLEGLISSTYWQCYQTNERAAFFVTTKVANGTADLLSTSVTQQLIEHTESMGYSLASSYVTLSPDVVHTSVRMLVHNFTFRRARQAALEVDDEVALTDSDTDNSNNDETIETYANIAAPHVGPCRQPLGGEHSLPPRNARAADIWGRD
ncbi:putative potassium voltage-gated channel [Trypanosoma grayi]|uniref:putative potassium voltage-gated channel n=1 Tax=Trypanosoma grayi TaxID=71804 RepID=UPI0004F4A41C|nr:putative potassium voltage-gated channel [Trypanosoma grayi]KEG08862.1 putative potassium voltage-gated channel [Trypanosoma grayi]